MKTIILGFFILLSPLLQAKMDLTVVPGRDAVQLTIYNSADLTLVRETRLLTVKKGINKLQFSWSGTLIDPTSLEMRAVKNGDKISVNNMVFPPRTKELGIWTINSEISGQVEFEISYFTSRISWNAFYHGTLSKDEKSMRLKAYVKVLNNSGEEYDNAKTRLVVGDVNLKELIAKLAKRKYAFGSPQYNKIIKKLNEETWKWSNNSKDYKNKSLEPDSIIKQIAKEALSEYYLYTIEGKETIPNRWAKRLPSFDISEIPVVNFYKYEEGRYGQRAVRFVSFKNDKKHKLGETPIPQGDIRLYRNTGDEKHLAYEGASKFKYIPVDQKAELNLGEVVDVIVEPKLMNYQKNNFTYNKDGNIDGWHERKTFQVTVKNTRDVKVKIKVTRNFKDQYWELNKEGDFGEYKKVDLDTVSFELELEPRSQKVFTYTHVQHEGEWRKSK